MIRHQNLNLPSSTTVNRADKLDALNALWLPCKTAYFTLMQQS